MAKTLTWRGAVSSDPSVAGNYLENDTPASGDTINVSKNPTGADVAISATDMHLVVLAVLNIDASFTAAVGTPTAYWQIGATVLRIGESYGPGARAGSGRIKINTGTNATAVTVYGTKAAATETTLPPVRLLGVHASNTLTVRGGSVGLACEPGEASTYGTVSAGAEGAGEANVLIGDGVTLATYHQWRGTGMILCAATVAYCHGGQLTSERAGAIATVYTYGGTAILNSSGTITNLHCVGGLTDFTRSNAARIVVNATLYAGGALKADPVVIDFQNNVILYDRMTATTAAA